MKNALLGLLILTATLTTTAKADDFRNEKAAELASLGQVDVTRQELLVRPDGESEVLGIGMLGPKAEKISAIIAASPRFDAFRRYTLEVTASDIFVKGAPLYGQVNFDMHTPADVANAKAVFSGSDLKVEIIEATQNTIEISDHLVKSHEVIDGQTCTLTQDAPLWLLKFTNANGESLTATYMLDFTSTLEDGKIQKYFPETRIRTEHRNSALCLSWYNSILKSPGLLN